MRLQQIITFVKRGQTWGCDGIGLALQKALHLVAVDLDHCVNPLTGEIEPWALDIIGKLCSYSEYSPSATGVRILAHGEIPSALKTSTVEMYDYQRYVTLTGHHLPGTPKTINERPDELLVLYRRYRPSERASAIPVPHVADHEPPTPDDLRLMSLAQCSKTHGDESTWLLMGKIEEAGYTNRSVAEFAFMRIARWWCDDDAGAMDRWYRHSRLYRPKWDEPRGDTTYGALTIANALAEPHTTRRSRKG